MLSAQEAEDANGAPLLEDMRTPEGDPVPAENWPNVPGVAVIVTEEWDYPDPDGEASEDDEVEYPDAVKVYTPVWVVTDVEASGLTHARHDGRTADDSQADNVEVGARREERRRVIANNKAWASAETVRREWLAGFLTRKSAPKGAEAVICEAVVTGHHTLSKAMDRSHPMLCQLLGIEVGNTYWGTPAEIAALATKPTTPKAATMTTLAAVVTAWEDSIGKHTWRNPTAWDARILGALIEWGYKPSEVERLLLGESDEDATATEAATSDESDQGTDEPAA